MAFMEWTDELVTTITEIDEQHQKLVSIVNELAQESADQAAVAGKLTELKETTKAHFLHEESLLKKHGFKTYPAHKAEHDALTEKLEFMHKAFSEDPGKMDVQQLLMFFKIWLQEHIVEIDKQYVDFLKEQGVT